MLVKGLGILDLIAGIILIFGMGAFIPASILIILGIIFLLKSSLGLFKDFASAIDLITGLLFIALAATTIPFLISLIFGIIVIQKGILSFL